MLMLVHFFFINVLCQKKRTPLHLASLNGKKAVVATLLRMSADVKARDAVSNYLLLLRRFDEIFTPDVVPVSTQYHHRQVSVA
jgi:hypothetical protein